MLGGVVPHGASETMKPLVLRGPVWGWMVFSRAGADHLFFGRREAHPRRQHRVQALTDELRSHSNWMLQKEMRLQEASLSGTSYNRISLITERLCLSDSVSNFLLLRNGGWRIRTAGRRRCHWGQSYRLRRRQRMRLIPLGLRLGKTIAPLNP